MDLARPCKSCSLTIAVDNLFSPGICALTMTGREKLGLLVRPAACGTLAGRVAASLAGMLDGFAGREVVARSVIGSPVLLPIGGERSGDCATRLCEAERLLPPILSAIAGGAVAWRRSLELRSEGASLEKSSGSAESSVALLAASIE